MMDRRTAQWNIGKNKTVKELGSESLEEIDNSEVGDDVDSIDDYSSNDDSFFDDENKFDCMDGDVFLPNIREPHSHSTFCEPTPKNEMTVRKLCFNWLTTCEDITSSPCMPYFGKWIDVEERAMLRISFSQKGDLVKATEDIFSGDLIANSSLQEIFSTGSQKTNQLSVTRTSSEDNCEK